MFPFSLFFIPKIQTYTTEVECNSRGLLSFFLSSSPLDCKEPVTENNIIMMMHPRHDEEKNEWRGNFLTSHSRKERGNGMNSGMSGMTGNSKNE